jgi:long-chain acyl-CoA synthetase
VALRNGLPTDLATLATHADVRGLVAEAVAAANEKYAPPARIRAFAVLGRDFDVENGELTPTGKVRRQIVAHRYAGILDDLYSRDP